LDSFTETKRNFIKKIIMKEFILSEIKESLNLKEKVLDSIEIITQIEHIVKDCIESINNDSKIIFCGNGGSFGDSQHLAAEFISRLRIDRNPLPSIALGTNSSNLTAIANDYGYDQVFKRELEALGKKNDVLIAISTSGNSPNVVQAVKTANTIGMKVHCLTGISGGILNKLCSCLKIPSNSTDKIQECHIMIGHIICCLVEINFFDKK
jgi:D-sedoheptulose 7-phosphate isomerase